MLNYTLFSYRLQNIFYSDSINFFLFTCLTYLLGKYFVFSWRYKCTYYRSYSIRNEMYAHELNTNRFYVLVLIIKHKSYFLYLIPSTMQIPTIQTESQIIQFQVLHHYLKVVTTTLSVAFFCL